MILWNIGIVCFIIELHQFTSGTPYIPQKRKQNLQMRSLYHSRDRIVAASRLLQIYTESVNPIGAVLSCFCFCFVLFFLATSCVSLLISVEVIKMEAIFIISFFLLFLFFFLHIIRIVDLYWFFESRTTNISLHMNS